MNRIAGLFTVLMVLCVLSASFSFADGKTVEILEMKIAQNIDEKYLPVNPAESFPAQTSRVFCWFKWKDAIANGQINVKCIYTTENTPILDYKVTIPRHEGSGGVGLSMPEGKTLPPGSYEVRLEANGKTLKSNHFTVLEK